MKKQSGGTALDREQLKGKLTYSTLRKNLVLIMDLNWLNPLFPIILKESRNNYSAFQNHKTGDDTHAVESFLT